HQRAGRWRCGQHRASCGGTADDTARYGEAPQAPLVREHGEDPWLASCTVRDSDDREEICRTHETPFAAGLESACFRPGKKIRYRLRSCRWARLFPRTGCALRGQISIYDRCRKKSICSSDVTISSISHRGGFSGCRRASWVTLSRPGRL